MRVRVYRRHHPSLYLAVNYPMRRDAILHFPIIPRSQAFLLKPVADSERAQKEEADGEKKLRRDRPTGT
jgi:hypothetical protein